MLNLLRWLTGLIVPFWNWRVPVTLLRGQARVSGEEVVLLSAGSKRWTQFITESFFAREPAVERQMWAPAWRVQRVLEEWRPAANLTVVGMDRVSAGLFLGKGYLALPQRIASWMEVPEDLQAFSRTHKSTRADIQRIRIKEIEFHLSRDIQDFEHFYDRFYRPYIMARHGDMSRVAPRWMLRYVFKRGAVQWVSRDEVRLAGGINTVKGTTYTNHVSGLLDGRMELLREGMLSSLFVHSVIDARRRGCTELRMGGSQPSLHDGVFRYKTKWASGLYADTGFLSANFVTLLNWTRLAGPVAEFLAHTSLIHHEEGGYAALWVYPPKLPLTAERLQKEYDALKAAGLHRFRILVPGKAPPDFICPSGVSLIELSTAEQAGPGGIPRLGIKE